MALSSTNLLQWIAHSKYLYKNYANKLSTDYQYGTVCYKKTKKLLLLHFYLQELELYYLDCSCLEEEDICNFIVEIQKLSQ